MTFYIIDKAKSYFGVREKLIILKLSIIIFLLCFALPNYGQDTIPKVKKNSIYAGLGGNAGFYEIGYERRFTLKKPSCFLNTRVSLFRPGVSLGITISPWAFRKHPVSFSLIGSLKVRNPPILLNLHLNIIEELEADDIFRYTSIMSIESTVLLTTRFAIAFDFSYFYLTDIGGYYGKVSGINLGGKLLFNF